MRNSDQRGLTLLHMHLALTPVLAASLRKSHALFQLKLATTHRRSISSNKETKVQTEVLQPMRCVRTQGRMYALTRTGKSMHLHTHTDTQTHNMNGESGPPGVLMTLCSPQGPQLRTSAARHVWAWNKHVFNSFVPSVLFLLTQLNPTPESQRKGGVRKCQCGCV